MSLQKLGGGISPASVLGFCTAAKALHFVLSGSARSEGEGSGGAVVLLPYSEGQTTYLAQSVSSPDIRYRFLSLSSARQHCLPVHHMLQFLQCADTLTSLEMTCVYCDVASHYPEPPSLVFPKLTHLSIGYTDPDTVRITNYFTTPCLRNLRLQCLYTHSFDTFFHGCERFLDQAVNIVICIGEDTPGTASKSLARRGRPQTS